MSISLAGELDRIAPISPARMALRRLLRNRLAVAGAVLVALFALASILLPLTWSSDLYRETHLEAENMQQSPTREHLLGTDMLGRDIVARVMMGIRISLAVGLAASLISLGLGVVYGGIAGYAGGRIDNAMMRLVDTLYSIPLILVVILLMVILQPGLQNVFIALGMVYWLGMARIVRGEILKLKEQDYVQAAQALGATPARILFRHLLPNTAGPVIVTLTFNIPEAIFAESFLSFIGLGVQAPTASLGSLASDGLVYITVAPWILLWPSLGISLLMLGFNFLGDGLRDAFDPQSDKR